MTKTFPEVISGIRTAKKGVEVREDIAQMGEYVEQFAATATQKAEAAAASEKKASDAVANIDQQKADSVAAVQQAQTTATTAITQTKDAALTDIGNAKTGALQEVASSTEAAQTAATEAEASKQAAEKSKEAAAASASSAGTKASEASASATQADTSQKKAAKNQQAAEEAANRASAIVSTDKTLSIENAPADAKAVGDIVLDPDGNAIFYSKAEVEAKIKEILAAQRAEDYARIKIWASNDPTSPASFIGGTWERIEGKFIMGASDTYPAGSTGGEAEHTLTEGELPNITGDFDFQSDGNNQGIVTGAHGVFSFGQISTGGFRPNNKTDESDCARQIRMSFGSNSPHNNIPPYYSVYIWRRVA